MKSTLLSVWLASLIGLSSLRGDDRYQFFPEEDLDPAVEVYVIRPTVLDDGHFLLYLESSNDLSNWQVTALPPSAVDEHGFIVVEGESSRQFWRLRVMPALRADEKWPTILRVRYDSEANRVEASLDVYSDYFPAVRDFTMAASEVPVPWVDPPDGLVEATEEALLRLRDLAATTRPKTGEQFKVRREL